ncbi:hypothetical protein HZC35_02860 [Candidatus Saganbacteria bacterium]|nr:hypothetical protein [Candidatus Saganbacteria bacterium]
MALPTEKRKAIDLRKRGFSYREILESVPVSKSTLSLWLRSVGLSSKQKQRLSQKKLEASRRGARTLREKKLRAIKEIKAEAKADISKISLDRTKLWLMGTMLYWAEGSKEKINGPSGEVKFSNSDPLMIKFFARWLVEICKVPVNHIKYELYIHENNKRRLPLVKRYWADFLGLNVSVFKAVYFKKHKIRTSRKKIGDDYFGQIVIRVRKSTALNRQISGWIEGINQAQWRVV